MGCDWVLLSIYGLAANKSRLAKCVTKELPKDERLTHVNRPEFSRPMFTLIQIAFVDLIQKLCVAPDVAIGRSSGETAAAIQLHRSSLNLLSLRYCTGAISHELRHKNDIFRGVFASKLAKTTSHDIP
ncbi:hypothetical protein BGZ60DRAFT_533476 [Tricladium varicosporioides]|nr:hypothetical protein BGZ60DRAFT_533476 [Hymenoscyphus varicosporioides]